jgi:hypothetical protein
MSGNGDKTRAKRRRPVKASRIPLLMLGSDGEVYACAPGRHVPRGVLQTQGVFVAVRLTHQERGIALDSLQGGIKEASRLLMGILDRKLGPKLDS